MPPSQAAKAKAIKAKADKAKKAINDTYAPWTNLGSIILHGPKWLSEPIPHAWIINDGRLWNLATIHDIHGDFSRVERKYHCQANPRHHLKDFPDAEYVLWFIQPYRDF
ncbi:hypothetical protein M422DRAFT_36117, partial [Sphaerobolus stellatus SS14]